jgi:hypothetical protein
MPVEYMERSSSMIIERFSVGKAASPPHESVNSEADCVPSKVATMREKWTGEGG